MKKAHATLGDLKKDFSYLAKLAKKIVELNKNYYNQDDFKEMSFSQFMMILEDRGLLGAFRMCSLKETPENIAIAKKARAFWKKINNSLGEDRCKWIPKAAISRGLELSYAS